MDADRWFRGIWRVNALVILVGGMLGVGAFGLVLGIWIQEQLDPPHVRDVANLSNARIVDEHARLGRFETIPGTRFLRAERFVHQELDYGLSGKDAASTDNVLFFDIDTRRARWLLPHGKRVVHTIASLPWEVPGQSEEPVRAIVYGSVESDTDGSGQLTQEDATQIGISGPTGRPFAVVVPAADELLEARLDGE